MERGIGKRVVVAAVVCFLLPLGFCQNSDDVYKGCYLDGDGEETPRVLTDLILCDDTGNVCQTSCGSEQRYCESGEMTIQLCQSLCRAKNFQYYGLEGGNQCFCGGAFAKPFVYGFELDNMLLNCSDPCTGDNSQTCGGEFRIKLYEFEEPLENPGCFFPGAVPNAIVTDVGVGVGETLSFTCKPGFELVGDSTLTCITNRTWSSDKLPICNYTGVFPEPTTELPTTTEQPTTTQLPTTTASATTTEDPTTEKPSTTLLLETTSSDVTTAKPQTTSSDVTTVNQQTTSSYTNKPDPTTKQEAPKTTVKVVPTKPQTSITDYLPYIIGGAAGLLLLLVIIMIAALTCKLRKRSGNANQNISLKPDDLAPVTLLNSGFTAGDDPEAEMPDILLASETRPPMVENEYVSQERPMHHEMSTFSSGKGGVSNGDDPFWKDPNTAYEDMKPLPPMEQNPIYESTGGSTVNDTDGSAEHGTNESPSEGDKAQPGKRVSQYEQMDAGKWGSPENVTSEDGDSRFDRDQRASVATKL